MDFDLSKENIQPLRRGRNPHQLEMALQAQTNPEYQVQLQQQKQEFEAQITNYQGDDPLEKYYEYIAWIEQSYPKNGHEGNCAGVLEYCLGLYENDPRYTNDIRFCKLWIKYIDSFPNPPELYRMMKSKNLCTGFADFYKAWAYYYEAAGDFQSAHNVIEEGKANLAQPYNELEDALKHIITAAGEHSLFGPNENRLQAKRQALTSLPSYKGKVNHVRHAGGSQMFGGGAIGVSSNVQLPQVFVDDGAGAGLSGGAAPVSIVTVAKRQEAPKENTMKPGPWTTVPHKKRVLSNHKLVPSFTLHEDESPQKCLPPNLPPVCLEDYANSSLKVALTNPSADDERPTNWHGYPKHKVYMDLNVEYSIEEIRALRYLKKEVQEVVCVEEEMDSILIEDDDDDCIVVVQDPPQMEQQGMFQIYQSPMAVNQASTIEIAPNHAVSHSPWKSQAEHQDFLQNVFSKNNESRLSNTPKFVIRQDSPAAPTGLYNLAFTPEASPKKAPSTPFEVYEQSMQELPPLAPPNGNAMKTTFRTLNADEVETGSRGGMDGAMAAQPIDGAKPSAVIPFSDSSSSSYDDPEQMAELLDCSSTQQFNFNLNAMRVSTPQDKTSQPMHSTNDQLESARKALFSKELYQCDKKALSTILEEKSYVTSSSSSGGTATKLSLYGQPTKMNTISEEHNSYLEQNLKANEELRRSFYASVMEDTPTPPVPMQYTPIHSPILNATQPLSQVPSDPFKAKLLNQLLDRVSFPGVHHQGFVHINGNPRLMVKKEKEPVFIGRDKYLIEKVLGKGQFGTVYKAYNYQMSCTVALKYQRPPNRWEFYICSELQARLSEHPLRDRFMDISIGYFSDQASILVSKFEPFGSLLDTANLIKLLPSKDRESLCIFFTLEMLKIVRAMHAAKIIHADIKPDNFLVMLTSCNGLALQLIDFGCSIDMSLFPDNAMFTTPISTENFICCEVRDGQPWSYHTDLFCVAASAHVLLFHEYINLKKCGGRWSFTSRLPRYTNNELWNLFFSSLLNQQLGIADLATLERRFTKELEETVRQKDLRLQLVSLTNLLKKR
ncbi:unnamed protein product [Ceutorhynchus assimilis]|uniref:Mitotic checkpoint serine/threonine-protein kinase BUB1 n=1 Tax=Ceutorhynchus assimilis TaxID=467358 RepID=A0A9N9MZ00_9CUCU|nr:unnamed protein product [Ceutorhynchus assimilis]